MTPLLSVPNLPSLTPRRTGGIRPFDERDIPQIVHLHQRVWSGNVDRFDAYREYFTRVFLEHPASAAPLPSLVCQQDDGRIVGFVGIVPRRLTLNGHHVHAAVSSQFIVDPRCPGLLAVRLAKAYLDGPQDLSIADEANDVSRRIWEGLGGTTALLHSLYWTRPLRPAGLAVSCLRQRRGFRSLAMAAGPFAWAADACATRLPGSYFRQRNPAGEIEELRGDTVLAHAPRLCGDTSLRVDYDERTLRWLLDRAGHRRTGGRLLTAAIKDARAILGWYICHLDHEGTGYVVHLAATPSSIDAVLDRLFYDAWKAGALAVSGRLDPRFTQALSDKYCLLHRRGPWVLVKARKPEITRAFQSGNAWFSPLDGEWALRF